MKIPRIIQTELDSLAKSGVPFRFQTGGKHHKIFIGDKFAGILPIGKIREGECRESLNIRSQIRRAAKQFICLTQP